MNPTYRNIKDKFIAFFLISIISMIALNQAIFIHSHLSNDGRMLVHAHPFKKSDKQNPTKSHHHSSGEIAFLDHSEELFNSSFEFGITYQEKQSERRQVFETTFEPFLKPCQNSGRAPPVS